MSATLPRAICASSVPSEGLNSGSVSPLAQARHWPPMNTPLGSKGMEDMATAPCRESREAS